MSIEDSFDVSFIAALALKEKQIQQNYRPLIAVHKWFARRPGTLFRGLLLAEFSEKPLADCYFQSNDLAGRRIVDPFMGGGTPLLEANRMGCDVEGFDVNPMSAWIVREEIEHLDLKSYRTAASRLISDLEEMVGEFYRTDCPAYGEHDVPVKYFLWVKILECSRCNREFDLFPGYLLADDTRHTGHVVVCHNCGELNEVANIGHLPECNGCTMRLTLQGPARKNRCACPFCGEINSYPRPASGAPQHRLFAIEYYNPKRKQTHSGRFFKKPDAKDLLRVELATKAWREVAAKFVPADEIPPGDETNRLHRWGYSHFRELFNDRQLLGLEQSCRLIAAHDIPRTQRALTTNLSDLLRYQNLLCRYDTTALKSLDIFSVHGFPVGLIQCESNLLGIVNAKGLNVGSGGWRNVVEKYAKGKAYCEEPFEIRHQGRTKMVVSTSREWIGEQRPGCRNRIVQIHCANSAEVELERGSVDAIFTDPPYFGNVQYGELMEFCFVWLKGLADRRDPLCAVPSARSPHELTGNQSQARNLAHFTDGLSAVFQRMRLALKEHAPLAFTFHHNNLEAYHSIGVAILDAQLVCTAAFPCPAEMGGSIHIHGTKSSIVDTVFVCRKAILPNKFRVASPREFAPRIREELRQLAAAGMKPTLGDMRCIINGHLTRSAIICLHDTWDNSLPVTIRLKLFQDALCAIADPRQILAELSDLPQRLNRPKRQSLPLFPEEDSDALPV